MLQINSKLKQARKLLGKTQEQCGKDSGINQKEISLLESGKREFIPNEYLFFLNEYGVDLNTIFEYNTEVSLKEDSLARAANVFREPNAYGSKDKYIANLEQQVEALTGDKDKLQKTIDELQEQLRFMRSNTDGRAKSA